MSKEDRIYIRVTTQQKDIIAAAAGLRDMTISSFVLAMAVEAAETQLSSQRVFSLDESEWATFLELLDRPSKTNAALSDLMNKPSIFEMHEDSNMKTERFELDKRNWTEFCEILDRPANVNSAVHKLMSTPSVFEQREWEGKDSEPLSNLLKRLIAEGSLTWSMILTETMSRRNEEPLGDSFNATSTTAASESVTHSCAWLTQKPGQATQSTEKPSLVRFPESKSA